MEHILLTQKNWMKIKMKCLILTTRILSYYVKSLKAMGQEKYKNGFKLTVHPESLQTPFEWKKPKTVFVNSMSDLFHKDIPLSFIQEVFKVMNDTPQHTYQILTKRPEITLKYN